MLKNNIQDIALVFEGGGMRASYSSAVVNMFLENGIFFDNVYGVSAGSSCAVNYLSRDTWRTKASFTDLADDPQFGGVRSFVSHNGIFNARYIYQDAGKPEGCLPFDFKTFVRNPAKLTISGFNRDTGDTLYWTRNALGSLDDLMIRVRASSSLPLAMPAPKVGSQWCYDGGLGEGSGIMIPRAKRDGFERYFVVCTRPKGYRKTDKRNAFINACFWRRPHVRRALAIRAKQYNEQLDELVRLEKTGQAYVFYAQEQGVGSGERDVDLLRANYERAYAQSQQEIETWLAFLNK